MSLRINNSNISEIKINGINIKLAKINDSIVFEINGEIITLSFNDKVISANSNKDGSYDFYYAKDGKIIEEYDKIVSFDLVANTESSYEYLNSFNIAPYDANGIVVCKSGTTKILSSSSLPSQFLFDSSTYGSKLYSVGLISDTHIDGDGTDTADSINDLKKALTLFSNENVSFISHCGDVTENNRASDYTAYSDIVADNTIPIKTIAGNHDNYSTLESITGNSLYYEYIPDGTNDIYLFLGSYQASTINPFSDEELTWLETKLEEYKNKRVFLFLHYYCDPVGDANNLDNDDLGTTEQALTFRNLMTTYKDNLVYFSGHSHLTYKMQELIATANVNSATDTLPKRVHIPSNGRPRILSDGRITNDYVGCECAIMDVYENCIVIRGKDLTDNKFLPIANYLLDTTLIQIGDDNLFDYNVLFNENGEIDKENLIPLNDGTWFYYYVLTLNPNTSYLIESNTAKSSDEPSFLVVNSETTMNTVNGNIANSRTVVTSSDGILKIGIRVKQAYQTDLPLMKKSYFDDGTYYIRITTN